MYKKAERNVWVLVLGSFVVGCLITLSFGMCSNTAMAAGSCFGGFGSVDQGGVEGIYYDGTELVCTADLNLNGNKVYDSTQALDLGTACTTSHSLVAGDVCIGGSGELEVDGATWFDGLVTFSGSAVVMSTLRMDDNWNLTLGSNDDTYLRYLTGPNPDATVMSLGEDSRILYINEKSDRNDAYTMAQQVDPTIVLQSASGISAETERLWLQHDQTDGVIDVGTGDVKLSNSTHVAGDTLTSGGIDDYTLYISQTLNDSGAAGGSDTYRAIKINLTETDTTGWDDVFFVDFQVGGSTKFSVATNGFVRLVDGVDFEGTARFLDQRNFVLGTGYDTYFRWMTNPTPDATVMSLGEDSRILYINENSDKNDAYTMAQQTNPTLVIQSASGISAETERIWFTHDQTDGVIDVGTGDIKLSNSTEVAGDTLTSGGTDDYSLRVSQTLNDSGAAGGSDVYYGISLALTETDVTGWDDVYLIDLDVGGTSQFSVDDSGNVDLAGAVSFEDDKGAVFGTGNDAKLEWNTNQTNHGLVVSVDNTNRYLMLIESGDESTDFGHTAQTNPSLYVHSADEGTVADYVSITHDQTDGVIDAGSGDVKIANETHIAADTLTSGGTDDYGLSVTQTLNDSGAAGGSDIYRGAKISITTADTTGWDYTRLLDLLNDAVSIFYVDASGGGHFNDTSGNGFYWHERLIDATAVSPGGSGATLLIWNTATVGYLLDATTEYLYFTADVEGNWDGISDIVVEAKVALNAAETANDIIQAELIAEYFGEHDDTDTSPKTQTRSIDHDIVSDNAQGDFHELVFRLDYDLVDNVIDVGDTLKLRFRLDSVAGGTDVAAVRFLYASVKYRNSFPAEAVGTFPTEG